MTEEELSQIANADSPIMRFTGEDGKTRGHDLTEAEISASHTILNLYGKRQEIVDVIAVYREENGL